MQHSSKQVWKITLEQWENFIIHIFVHHITQKHISWEPNIDTYHTLADMFTFYFIVKEETGSTGCKQTGHCSEYFHGWTFTTLLQMYWHMAFIG